VLLGHGPNKAFLALDSCRATERNGNSISADITDDTIENNKNDACFSYFWTIWLVFWIF
jgi:hypothetical protein